MFHGSLTLTRQAVPSGHQPSQPGALAAPQSPSPGEVSEQLLPQSHLSQGLVVQTPSLNSQAIISRLLQSQTVFPAEFSTNLPHFVLPVHCAPALPTVAKNNKTTISRSLIKNYASTKSPANLFKKRDGLEISFWVPVFNRASHHPPRIVIFGANPERSELYSYQTLL